MNEEVLLSVIVPVYNVEPYLRRCLDSILGQTYHVDEIICVDDGSTDNSLQIIKEYAQKNSNIVFVHTTNGGIVNARKTGLKMAHGKYIAYVDSDDWIEENMYEDMLSAIIANDADLVTSGCVRDYGSHIFYQEENIMPGIYEGEILRDELKGRMIETKFFFRSNISMHIYNKIFTRKKLSHKLYAINNEINMGDDAACVYPYILDSEKIIVMGKSYYHYCIRDNSTMGHAGYDEYKRGYCLRRLLRLEFNKHKDISNIDNQYNNLVAYVSFLQCAEAVIRYIDNILVPYGEIYKFEKTVIIGKGKFGIQLEKILLNLKFNIVACLDKKSNVETQRIDQLNRIEYDKILIAVLDADMVSDICEDLKALKVDSKKIMQINPQLLF